MADKIKGNSGGGGGGGGRGGGGSGSGSEPAFHKLLPNIAEVVEILDVTTVEEVQEKVEEATSVKYSKSEVILGLENGRQLGLFVLERQFKLNTKYINEELKGTKGDLAKITALLRKKLQEEKEDGASTRRKKTDRMRTKSRSKKSTWEDGWSTKALQKTDKRKICGQCKTKKTSGSPGDSESYMSSAREPNTNNGKRPANRPEVTASKRKKAASTEEQKNHQSPQKKSKLLVEKNNPLENESPYYDIYT